VVWDQERNAVRIDVRNKFHVGDWVEVIHPSGNRIVQINALEGREREPVDVGRGVGHAVWVQGDSWSANDDGAYLAKLLEAPSEDMITATPPAEH
jgi:putative protease